MSWEKQKVLNSGRAGYAALARLKDGTIVTLSEEQGGYGDLSVTGKELYHIVFRRFNLRWLTDMKDYYTPPNQALRRRW
ncbi:sialidase family protein [Brachyspira intermedia]